MSTTKILLLFLLFKTCLSQDLNVIFKQINEGTGNFSAIAANLAWQYSINPGNPELQFRSATYQKTRIIWQQQTCDKLATLFNHHSYNSTQIRQTYLLCRGPKYTYDETRRTSGLYEDLQIIYSDAEICIPTEANITTHNLTIVEDAILNYLSNVQLFLGFKQIDYILLAAKIAVNRYIQEKEMLCLKGERDFEKMMAFSRNELVLKWLWLAWREKVGPPMKGPYRKLVKIENKAARRNGYPNIGTSWRNELEVPQLRQVCQELYEEVKPLYKLLHGVVRFYLRQHYGEVVPDRGPIPAHLLGNLWSQNWEPLADLLLPETIDLNGRIKDLNWTVMHMVKRAEDFYQSMGLPAMTDKFWRESVFTRENNTDTRCHGTAADMFQDGDFRLLYCSETSEEDFYVLHHELGHIQYYMAYEQQPALFRQANTALHEAIGDAIMYGVLTPQHLNRLGLINDTLLYTYNTDNPDITSTEETATFTTQNTSIEKKESDDKTEDNVIGLNVKENNIKKQDTEDTNNDNGLLVNGLLNNIKKTTRNTKIDILNQIDAEDILKFSEITDGIDEENKAPKLFEDKDITTDTILLLKQALNKIPQIPFSLLLDEYRWNYFEGSLKKDNEDFWIMVMELQGVAPPSTRGEEYFDVGAKFHVPDNTPYIRYFLSSFLQHQLFEKLCQAAVFGRRNADEPVPETITWTRCDIYGSKAAGKVLKDVMSRGHSQHWSEILQATTGEHNISAAALNRYYRPLYDLLEKFVRTHRVPIGW